MNSVRTCESSVMQYDELTAVTVAANVAPGLLILWTARALSQARDKSQVGGRLRNGCVMLNRHASLLPIQQMVFGILCVPVPSRRSGEYSSNLVPELC